MKSFIWTFYMHIQVFIDRVSEHTVMHIEAHKQYEDMPCLPPSGVHFPVEVATETGKMFITKTSLSLNSMMVHVTAYGQMSAMDVKWMFEKDGWHFPDENEKKLEEVIKLGKEMEITLKRQFAGKEEKTDGEN